jgi:NAD(P)-dependent dehydrogenase (short-subunit alcohol dehydrogenase family)
VDIKLDIAPLTMQKTGLPKDALAGQVAVVTGGTSNIGLGTARSLAWAGAKVVIVARSPDKGKAAQQLIDSENKPGTALFISADVSDETAMKDAAQRAFDTFGKVDILVNNAMDMSHAASIMKSTVHQLDRQYEVAARGTLIGIQTFVPGMLERHHGVVTYLSTAFAFPMGPANYCAAKSAASSIITSLAAELGPAKDTGVAVFQFLPTTIGRPRTGPVPANISMVPRAMPGYDGAIPPEDCGAALTYCVTRGRELHGSGLHMTQVNRQISTWVFPKPETLRKADYDRVRDEVTPLVFGYIGPGFPDAKLPLVSINRSENKPRAY